jgi:putative membrane protein
MLLQIILALAIGVLSGTLTGLFPGIHINLIAVLILSISFIADFEPLTIAIFLVAMAITHTFVDYIPSVLLGAPDEDNFLSILPGHEFLMKGKAYRAIIYTLYGSAAAIGIILILSPLFIFFLYKAYPYVQRIIPYILIIASIFLIYFEKKSRLWATIIFFLSGFLGIAALNLPTSQPLLPLFTGLFGISSLITSILRKEKIPKQKISKLKSIKIKTKTFIKAISAALIASPLVSFLPGLGTGQAAVIGSEVTGDMKQKEFLVLLGAINTVVIGLSFITLYAVGKARTGTAVAINQIIKLSLTNLIWLIVTIVLARTASFFITIYIAKYLTKNIHKFNYKYLSYSIITILVILTIIFSGFIGLFILATSSILGLATIRLGIRRTHLMGALMLPIILIYVI